METELTALDTATVEAEWLHELLMDLLVVEKPSCGMKHCKLNLLYMISSFGWSEF
jgi:hypothetical protein